jgi:MFS transporter, Spinster family, sphingosine-1-phosphate transporter
MSTENAPRKVHWGWVVVGLLFPVALLNYLDRQMMAAMKTSVMGDVSGLSTNEQWGIMLAQFKWCYAFFSPIGGLLADRASRKWTIIVSLVCWSGITFYTGLVDSYQGLLSTRTAMGISEAFYIPAALALISDYHAGTTRSKAVGIHQTGIYLGVILGGFSGYAADAPDVGWRITFHVIGLLGIVYAIPLMFLLRDPQIRSEDDSTDSRTGQSGGDHQTGGSIMNDLFLNPSFGLLVAYFTLPAMAAWVIRDWMPSILKEKLDISQGLAGISATFYFQVAAIATTFFAGWLADRWSKKYVRGRIYVSAIGMSLMVPALLAVGSTAENTLIGVIAALIVFGVAWAFFDCNNMPILCQIVRPHQRATGYGIMNFVSISGGAFADWGVGILYDAKTPMFVIFSIFAALCLVSVFLVFMIRPGNSFDSSSHH